uniref:ATP synthase complex subunit 8 n=1 Tax=Palaestes scutellaris TaxID=2528288 RepID=A0A7G7MU08_9CUCU|nr:ATP synthase F0 subunit 8 [Palaestes scutellaris]
MPQMAPLSWLSLFLFFVMIFIMFNIMNYFSFNYSIKPKKFWKKFQINWKW